MATLFETLQTLDIPVAYGFHTKQVDPPYMVYIGNGQDAFEADNSYYTTKDRYQIELYFEKKSPDLEKRVEALLLENGYRYEKSEDVYIDDQDVFVIYYNV